MRHLLLAAAAVTLAAQQCPPNSYCVQIGLAAGSVVRLPSSPSPLDAGLDKALASLDKPYRLTLTPEQQQLDDQDKLPDPDGLLAQAKSFSGTIADFFPVLQSFCNANPDCQAAPPMILSTAGLLRAFTTYQDIGLLFDIETGDFNEESGAVVFRVVPNFQSARVAISIPGSSSPQRRILQLRRWLRPLDGQLWNRPAVAARLIAFYANLGLDPQIDSSIPGNSITILEGTRLHGIAFPFGLPLKRDATNWNKVDQALYSVLPDRVFRHGYLARRTIVRDLLLANESPVLEIDTGLATPLNTAPFLSRLQAPIQQILLQQSNLSLAVTNPTLTFRDNALYSLAYYRLEDLSAAPPITNAAPSVPAPADSHGHVNPTAALPNPSQSPSLKTGALDCVDDTGQRPKSRYAGFGLTYKPGQGLRAFALGQQNFASSGLSVRTGQGGPGAPLATANFSSDYILFSRLHRRLSFSFQGGTDSEANRFFGAGSVNEQRTGAKLRTELELFRDRRGHLFKLFAEPARTKVSLASVARTTTLDIGALHFFQSSSSPYPWTWRFEPTFRKGFQTAAVPAHLRASALARFHKLLPAGWAIDLTAQAAFASASTPIFDLPSLGGADNLRGFRRDDAIATRLWTVQPELWTPLDLKLPNLKLALFSDLGNAGDLSQTPRRGPGLGLRYLAGPFVLRADWAYGFGPAATGGSRGKFYLSVTSNLPF